jgi:hypothetical protein
MRQTLLAAIAGVMVVLIQAPLGATEAPDPPSTSDVAGEALVEVRQAGGFDSATTSIVDDVVRAARAKSTELHRVTLRLLSVTRGDEFIQQAPDGFGYPMLISAIDPGAPVLSSDLLAVLRSGEAVMGELTARLRGAALGDSIELESVDGTVVTLRIGEIVPDTDLRWSELLVGLDSAAALGIERPFGIVIWGAPAAQLQAALRLALPSDAIRISGPILGDGSSSDGVLPVAMVKERFGEFAVQPAEGDAVIIDPEWFDAWIVTVDLPIVGQTRCHRKVVPYIRAVLLQIEHSGLAGLLDPVDFQIAGGCYNPRFNRGADPGYSLSRHSWGIAIDFNPSTNAYGAEPALPAPIVDVFRRWGFSWGGGWSVPDGMHFEWSRLPESYSADCADLTMIEDPPTNSWLLAPAAGDCP